MDILSYLIEPDANDVSEAFAWIDQAQQEEEDHQHESEENEKSNND